VQDRPGSAQRDANRRGYSAVRGRRSLRPPIDASVRWNVVAPRLARHQPSPWPSSISRRAPPSESEAGRTATPPVEDGAIHDTPPYPIPPTAQLDFRLEGMVIVGRLGGDLRPGHRPCS